MFRADVIDLKTAHKRVCALRFSLCALSNVCVHAHTQLRENTG